MRIWYVSWILFLVLCASLVACGPLVTIIHADQTHPNARVFIDGDDEGIVDYGDSLSTRVDWGQHHIIVVDDETGMCIWTGEEEGWSVWVVDEVNLTLLPPPEEVRPIEESAEHDD